MAEEIKKDTISPRNRHILKAVVNSYIQTAEPIGSRSVAKTSGLGLSPATIRNCMVDLEDEGLLFQPYVSAGRLPTESGLRFYVKYLLEKEPLSWGDQVAIEREIMIDAPDISAVLKKVVQVLACYSGHAAVVSCPRLSNEKLKHIEFLKVRPGLVLVITVSEHGMTQNRLVQFEKDISEKRLEYLNKYIKAEMKNSSLEELRSEIVKALEDDKRVLNLLIEGITGTRLANETLVDILVEGKLNLLNEPEFADIPQIKALLEAFEEKQSLVAILDKCLNAEGVQVLIGAEGLGREVPGCGMVLAPYVERGRPLGSLGIVGPMRMNYARMVALVEYAAEVLSERFKER